MLSKRLKEILNEKKISLEYYSQMSNIPIETLRNVYYGRTSNPNIKTVMAMAEALDMTINSLLGVENSSSHEEQRLVHYYRGCGKHGKDIIMNMARYEDMLSRYEREAPKRYKIICMRGNGDLFRGVLYDPEAPYEIFTDKKEAYMAFETSVNDAAPTYCKGDIILLENRFPVSGEHALFLKEEKALMRIFLEEKDGYHLEPIHRMGEKIYIKKFDQVQCLGTCCGIIRT